MAAIINTDNINQVTLVITSLIDMIKNPNMFVNNNAYFYHPEAKEKFLVYIYLFKLTISNKEYLEDKYQQYLHNYSNDNFDLTSITNKNCDNILELIYSIKDILISQPYNYSIKKDNLIFSNNEYVDVKWLLSFLSLLLDNTKDKELKEINICYTIPNKEISKLTNKDQTEKFLSQFIYYNIKVKHTSVKANVRENNILVIKNAAINYLKHLKQYKHDLETEESYLLFYNLLKNECQKEGLELEEQEKNLLNTEPKILDKIRSYIDDEFYQRELSKQVHIIENIIWQSSNDITLIEYTNKSIDSLLDFLKLLDTKPTITYKELKKDNNINDIQILSILITNKFLLTYLRNDDEIDYSLLDLSPIKPQYMNKICHSNEQELKNELKSLKLELNISKRDLDKYKARRQNLNKEKVKDEKFKRELELCVGNINRVSITIARLNSNISSISKEYEDLKKEQEKKYRNVDLYNYNHSIIKHICNSITGCSFYLKTNNTSSLFSNIIIFEDYERTDNSFYLEVSFKELLKISNQYKINGIIDQKDLPKLA